MFALVDVTSMYASVEKIYNPNLRNKPVMVLSNNDGCVVAACPIAKRLGFKKFVPYFQVKEEAKKAGVVVCSSNYELYADASSKLFSVMAQFCDELHEYSIDEAFMRFSPRLNDSEWLALGYEIRKTIWREVKLPVGVGFGPTPTLAKAANHAAKKLDGFRGSAVINTPQEKQALLSRMAVADVWGIGGRLEKRLMAMGINNAYTLSQQSPAKMRKYFSIVLENTVRELQGELRMTWNEIRPAKKEIYSTRSFGNRVTTQDELRAALATHAEIATKKLRAQHSLAHSATFFAANSPHDEGRYVKQSALSNFAVPTNDTRHIIHAASEALNKLFIPGVRYYKVGVGLLDICDETNRQDDLFTPSTDNSALMAVLDSTNARYGRNTIHFGARGFQQKFAMKRDFLTKRATTRWEEIPRIKC